MPGNDDVYPNESSAAHFRGLSLAILTLGFRFASPQALCYRLLRRLGCSIQLRVGKMQTTKPIKPNSSADRKLLIDGLTLVALGLSVLFLNSWDTLFVRTAIGLFWGTFFLISNWSGLVQLLHGFRQTNDTRRRSTHRSPT
jgi:hypothetical protein